jgi:hypothetical protein
MICPNKTLKQNKNKNKTKRKRKTRKKKQIIKNLNKKQNKK